MCVRCKGQRNRGKEEVTAKGILEMVPRILALLEIKYAISLTLILRIIS